VTRSKNLIKAVVVIGLFCAGAALAAESGLQNQETGIFERYHNYQELAAVFNDLAAAHPAFIKVHNLSQSAGGRNLFLVEIGPETAKAGKTYPAVFVAANMEGTVPLASEAALFLARALADKPEVRSDRTWYVLPCGNPDAAGRFFAKPLIRDSRNAKPHNDDMDDAVDEDGPEDLNGDGKISVMRVKEPGGEWLPVEGEARLMKRADWSKGEKGVFKLYPEGLDKDGDGIINEDGPGGVNVGLNFPHLFQFFTRDGGPWPGSENESFALMKFIDSHREIGLAIVFGEANFCLNPPRGGRKGEADLNQIKIPERFAGFMGADPNKTYTMNEIIELIKPMAPPGMEISESMIASFLGLGAVVNPLEDDLKFYRELSEKYKEFLKKNKLDGKRLEPASDKDGSFELWAYYHLGLPSFAIDFWTPPIVEEKKSGDELTPEKLEKMSDEEFINLGEEKIDLFLKSAGAPAQFRAQQLIEAVKGGMMDTKRMAEMMKQMPKPPSAEGADPREKALLAFSDKELGGKGFVAWKPFAHPTLGQVEIGGPVPFADNTPPARMIEPLLKGQVPWVFEIAAGMARIRIFDISVKDIGGGIYEIKTVVENVGALPYPTAMGQRNQRLLPVILTVEGSGFDIVGGQTRSFIQSLKPLETKTVTWMLRAKADARVRITAETKTAWRDSRPVDLGGSK